VRKRERPRLTPDDWAKAALEALARGGIDAVAVEPLAAELGATKGSFYWHFKNRDALVEAALRLWERRRTDAVIEFLDRVPDPAQRLRTLIEVAYEQGPGDRVEIALLSNPGNRVAVRTMRRVSKPTAAARKAP
jgi:AcrR family transcriptional regulator